MSSPAPRPLLPAFRRLARTVAGVVVIGGVAASAAQAAPAVTLTGGTAPAPVRLCGATHPARAVPAGGALALHVAAARLDRVRTSRRGSTVVVDRCQAGRWTALATVTLGARRTPLHTDLTGTAGPAADLRVRTRSRSGRFGRAAFARVGVGEIVDVPVSFAVVNQNRTPLPCPGTPDGKPYTLHGTLVAPRAVLEAPKPAVTLYLHGLGYSGGLFFRFQDVPGYDYGLQQAQAGHASVVLDRLGNPSHDDLPDGNATCLPAQADMADQVVKALRKGSFTVPGTPRAFDRVLLAGHSAGGLVTEITQYAFASADAIAVIAYNDAPSPLALAQFSTAGGDCLTAPQHAHGTTGAPNYAPFGRTDADFTAAHFHDIDPVVARAVLARHNRDPCGDLLSALQGLIGNEILSHTIGAPVLIISGADDALFTPPTNKLAAATAYPASSQVTLDELPDTGHAVTLGRTHDAFRSAMDRWLSAHGA